MADDFDFSCIPCAGQICFPRPVAERKACTKERHGCPYRATNPEWLCRCCDDCKARCAEHEEMVQRRYG
jgi:hypothetical protein